MICKNKMHLCASSAEDCFRRIAQCKIFKNPTRLPVQTPGVIMWRNMNLNYTRMLNYLFKILYPCASLQDDFKKNFPMYSYVNFEPLLWSCLDPGGHSLNKCMWVWHIVLLRFRRWNVLKNYHIYFTIPMFLLWPNSVHGDWL